MNGGLIRTSFLFQYNFCGTFLVYMALFSRFHIIPHGAPSHSVADIKKAAPGHAIYGDVALRQDAPLQPIPRV